jgi:hypothetical protein
MFHIFELLLHHIPKLLVIMEERLPDRPRLGVQLVLLGLAICAPVLAIDFSRRWGLAGDLVVVVLAMGGSISLFLGAYILLRRGVLTLQDRRASRMISVRWK